MTQFLRSLILIALIVIGFFCVGTQSAYAGPFDTCNFSLPLKDGRYGFVWKPTGAHRPQAVLVLPSRFKGFIGTTKQLVVRSATLYRADTLAKIGVVGMKSNGICVGGGECLDRPTFAHPTLSGAAISRRYGKIRIRVVTNVNDHVFCTKSFDPKNRQD